MSSIGGSDTSTKMQHPFFHRGISLMNNVSVKSRNHIVSDYQLLQLSIDFSSLTRVCIESKLVIA